MRLRLSGQFPVWLLVTVFVWGAVPAVAQQQQQAKPGTQVAPEAEPAARDDANAPPPQNPLGNLLRNLLGPRAGGQAAPNVEVRPVEEGAAVAEEDIAAEDATGKDDAEEVQTNLDVTLNSNSAASRDLQRIEPFIDRERWHDVAMALQTLIELPQDTFTPRPRAEWTSLRGVAEQRLRGLPPAAHRAYHVVYAQVAAQALEEANRSGDVSQIVKVASRYAVTPAGAQAILQVARLLFDRGDAAASVRWYERLAEEERRRFSDEDRLRYASALQALGRTEQATALLKDGETAIPLNLRDAPPRFDWPQTFGSPTHAAVVRAEEPLLTPDWTIPQTYLQTVHEQVSHLLADLSDASRPRIPTATAVAANGAVAVRTLHGLQVVGLDGATLWERPGDDKGTERLLAGLTTGTLPPRDARAISRIEYSGSGDYDYHALTSLLFRDAVTTSLSTDGVRLFSLEDHAVLAQIQRGYYISARQTPADPLGRDWGTNRLVAQDLKTGRELWKVGGPRMNEPFDLPLAGTYFFGAPTVAEGRLYVVGEQQKEISLYVLDSQTGTLLGSQVLASATAEIELDQVRRLWTAQPAVAGGIVLCPTTTGWLVAVDRQDLRLLWAYGYEKESGGQRVRRFGTVTNALQALGTRWSPTPPMVVGHRVLFAPSELPDPTQNRQPMIVCLDLLSGDVLWQHVKTQDDVALAGVSDEHILVLGKNQLRALSLASGQQTWSLTLDGRTGPTGRGLLSAAGSWAVPLSNGELWFIKTVDGTVQKKLTVPEGAPPLGNLTVHRNVLISVDPHSIRCFAPQSQLEAEIARRTRTSPDDPWALTQKARIALLANQPEQALALLNRADPQGLEEADAALHNRLLHQVLWDLVDDDLLARDREYDQLKSLVTNDRKLEFDQLTVRRLMAREQWDAAWTALQPLLESTENPLVPVAGENRTVRLDVWLAGQLADLSREGGDELADAISRRADELVAALTDAGDDSPRSRFLETVLRELPQGRRLTRGLAEAAEQRDDYSAAEVRWKRLTSSPEPAQAANATIRLAQWRVHGGRFESARETLASLADEQYAALSKDSQKTLAELQSRLASAEPAEPAVANWQDLEFTLTFGRSIGYRPGNLDVSAIPGTGAFFELYNVALDRRTQRLNITGPAGEDYWTVPLRLPQRAMFENSVGLLSDGLHAYAVWQGVVHCLSLTDKKVIWAAPIALRSASDGSVRNVSNGLGDTLLTPEQFLARNGVRRLRSPSGMLAAATADVVLVYGQRDLLVLDPLTGELLWKWAGLGPQSMAYADGSRIYLFPGETQSPVILRALDGKQLQQTALEQHAPHGLALSDGQLLVHRRSSRTGLFRFLGGSKDRLESIDLQTGQPVWSQSVASDVLLGWAGRHSLALYESDHSLSLLEISSGSIRNLGQIPQGVIENRRNVQLLVDNDLIFLLIDEAPSHNISHLSGGVRVNGHVACFDRNQSRLLWHRPVKEQNLVASKLSEAPVLVFLNQNYDNPGYFHTNVLMLDKRSGKVLLHEEKLALPSQIQSVDVDLAASTIVLNSYNVRVNIVPQKDAPADDAKQKLDPADPPQDALEPAGPAS